MSSPGGKMFPQPRRLFLSHLELHSAHIRQNPKSSTINLFPYYLLFIPLFPPISLLGVPYFYEPMG